MPRPRHQLEPVVKALVANNPGWGPQRIQRAIEEQAHRIGRHVDAPSEDTIARTKKRMTDEEREGYQYARWPETWRAGVLQPDTAPLYFEFWRDARMRPSVRLLRCLYEVTAATGDEFSLKERAAFALRMLAADPDELREIEDDILNGRADMDRAQQVLEDERLAGGLPPATGRDIDAKEGK
jgi:hypothetical protein